MSTLHRGCFSKLQQHVLLLASVVEPVVLRAAQVEFAVAIISRICHSICDLLL